MEDKIADQGNDNQAEAAAAGIMSRTKATPIINAAGIFILPFHDPNPLNIETLNSERVT